MNLGTKKRNTPKKYDVSKIGQKDRREIDYKYWTHVWDYVLSVFSSCFVKKKPFSYSFFAAIKAFSRKRFLVKTAKKAEHRPLSSKSGAGLGLDCFVLYVRCCVLFAANLMMEGKSLARVEGEGGAID